MDERENIMALLHEADRECSNKPCITCKYQPHRFFCKLYFYADHLLYNGVTVQKLECSDMRSTITEQ